MIVEKIVRHAYTFAWKNHVQVARFQKTPLPRHLQRIGQDYAAIADQFSFDKVQAFVDAAIQNSSTPMEESGKHRHQLRVLAIGYARILFNLMRKYGNSNHILQPEQFYVSAINILKRSHVACGIYPCYDPESNPTKKGKGAPLPIDDLTDVELSGMLTGKNEIK